MFCAMLEVIRDREENLTNITDQRRKIHNEIQEERRKINEHLDKLEENVIGNLDAEEAKIKSEIENLLCLSPPALLQVGNIH
jgi:peptidoglycan hydrolase CwlO-like protein